MTYSAPPADYVQYGERKQYLVAESLAEYTLDKPARLASMYRTVLTELTTADDRMSRPSFDSASVRA